MLELFCLYYVVFYIWSKQKKLFRKQSLSTTFYKVHSTCLAEIFLFFDFNLSKNIVVVCFVYYGWNNYHIYFCKALRTI